ncbi:ArnT family glycosyltransferase [Aquihabitans daechungensis]|uniref:ArnT family glycosyltransferase n=1 Tax=Aquihabitans daechungensis TaxID=1052257 RepID=UPI003BA02288
MARGARIPAIWRRSILIVLSLVFFAVGMHQADRDAPTVDEGVDVSSGVSVLVRHDLRMNPEHPVLPKILAALPALIAQPIVPDTQAWRDGDWFDWSDDFIAANAEAGRLHEILLWSRAVLLLETVAAGALLYLLTRRFFGPDGGLLAAVAWLTTPYVVGLGHFAMIDIPFVVMTLAFCLLLARWVDHPSTGRTVALGLVLAAGLASRHTALVLVLVAVAVMVHHLRKTPREAATAVGVAGLTSLAGLWLLYRGLAPSGSSADVQASFNGLIDGAAGGPARLVGLLPLPLEWRAGFAYLDLTSTDRPASLLGRSWDGGMWWFFPVSAALKLPLTLVAAIVVGWAVVIRRALHRRALLVYVVIPALALWLLLLAQPLNLGLRLAMPIVALAFVGLGPCPRWCPTTWGPPGPGSPSGASASSWWCSSWPWPWRRRTRWLGPRRRGRPPTGGSATPASTPVRRWTRCATGRRATTGPTSPSTARAAWSSAASAGTSSRPTRRRSAAGWLPP